MTTIFIHGLGQDASSWDETISFMNISKRENIIALDLLSLLMGKPAVYENLYQSLEEYCEAISEPINFCGLSLGAILALNYTIDNPQKVNSLVLIGGQAKMPKGLLKAQNVIFQFIPKSFFKKMGFEKKAFLGLTSSMVDLDFSQQLEEISCKTVIICGEKDQANKNAANLLAAKICNAECQFVPQAGHELNKEAPKELAEMLDSFYI
ncbi:alpha/beta fold hydrolase [Carnobacterium gallinarum]|uniref:alpha/beta fold hydrolase n=1 Tax=Carnobacterium gallinarum TaxID=2749 RepID=UPI00054CFEBC|nr:alpha/beta hydrolase [Carnobacterium gallinarum]